MTLIDFEQKQRPFAGWVRVVAYLRRFIYNCRSREKRFGSLSKSEKDDAEEKIILQIQQDSFPEGEKQRFIGLEVFQNQEGLLYINTRVVLTSKAQHMPKSYGN